MPISSVHPSYKAMSDRWQMCRDAYAGSDAIKAGGDKYLPKLSGQSKDEYDAYKLRALFYGMTAKTISALVGMATARPPKLVYPPDMSTYFEEGRGLQFLELLGTTMSDILLMGRIGHFIDAPIGGGEPYVSIYPTESIINWDTDEQGNITFAVLMESVLKPKENDPYEYETVTQYRELSLTDGIYTVKVFNDKDEEVTAVQPMYGGQYLDYIPFYIANPFGLNTEIVKPPSSDIVDINLSHYRSSADLEHGRHFTGLPTPVAIGVDAATVLRIGSMTAWNIPDANGDAKYLEFTGQGLRSLEKALSEKEAQLASLSARFIDNSARGSEAVDVVRMRFMSETASLAINARAAEALCQMSYRTISKFKRLRPETIEIELNTDFMSGKLTGAEIESLISSYLNGGLTLDTLIYNLRRGEIIPPTMTDEMIKKNLTKPVEKDIKSDNSDNLQ